MAQLGGGTLFFLRVCGPPFLAQLEKKGGGHFFYYLENFAVDVENLSKLQFFGNGSSKVYSCFFVGPCAKFLGYIQKDCRGSRSLSKYIAISKIRHIMMRWLLI